MGHVLSNEWNQTDLDFQELTMVATITRRKKKHQMQKMLFNRLKKTIVVLHKEILNKLADLHVGFLRVISYHEAINAFSSVHVKNNN